MDGAAGKSESGGTSVIALATASAMLPMGDARGDYNTRLPAVRGPHLFHSSMALFSITDAQLAFGHVALLD
ncbi:hypothetical protein J8J32_21875, partial [Mycobacterium tuberculosis]|nr:hypothetical protein [Mycobacterium tuberculosis]